MLNKQAGGSRTHQKPSNLNRNNINIVAFSGYTMNPHSDIQGVGFLDPLRVCIGCSSPERSVKGEYGAAITCAGARVPPISRAGSPRLGRCLCSSCSLSNGSPAIWYLAQLTGGHRKMFCGVGIGGNFEGAWSGEGERDVSAESLWSCSLRDP